MVVKQASKWVQVMDIWVQELTVIKVWELEALFVSEYQSTFVFSYSDNMYLIYEIKIKAKQFV